MRVDDEASERAARAAFAELDRNGDGHFYRADLITALRAPERGWLRDWLGLPTHIRQEGATRADESAEREVLRASRAPPPSARSVARARSQSSSHVPPMAMCSAPCGDASAAMPKSAQLSSDICSAICESLSRRDSSIPRVHSSSPPPAAVGAPSEATSAALSLSSSAVSC